jgi:hypothetical protein
VDYVLGLARNARLRKLIEPQMVTAALLEAENGKPARVFTEFRYKTTTGSWGRERRVVAKAEHLQDKENPRYVATSRSAEEWPAQKLYEELYCERGEMEKRIKEQLSLFADRVSTESLRSNQLRLYLSAMAKVIVYEHLDGTVSIGLGPHTVARLAAEGPSKIATVSEKKKGCGKDALMETVEKSKPRTFPPFPQPLGNPAHPAGFPLSHSPYYCWYVSKTLNPKPDRSCATKTGHLDLLRTAARMKRNGTQMNADKRRSEKGGKNGTLINTDQH